MSLQLALFDEWPAKRYRGRRQLRNDQPWHTAVHEAGHAVMARSLNVPFSLVTIRPSLGQVLGRVVGDFTAYIHGDSTVSMPKRMAAFATILVAGPMAEHRLAFTPLQRTVMAGSDYEVLDKLLGGTDVPDENKTAAILSLEQVVGDFLVTPPASLMVLQLALALTHRITLTHAEAVLAMGGEFAECGTRKSGGEVDEPI